MERITLETEDAIRGLFGKYRPLSNYDTTPIKIVEVAGVYFNPPWTFKSGEHAFHWFKTHDEEWQIRIFDAPTPKDAKYLGKKCPIREDWEEIKDQVMLDIQRHKFQNPFLRKLLLSTETKLIEETNDWGDKYWGVCEGIGKNKFGKILEQVRTEIQIQEAFANMGK